MNLQRVQSLVVAVAAMALAVPLAQPADAEVAPLADGVALVYDGTTLDIYEPTRFDCVDVSTVTDFIVECSPEPGNPATVCADPGVFSNVTASSAVPLLPVVARTSCDSGPQASCTMTFGFFPSNQWCAAQTTGGGGGFPFTCRIEPPFTTTVIDFGAYCTMQQS